MQMSSDCPWHASPSSCVPSLRPGRSHSILAAVFFPEVLMTHRYIKLGLTATVLVLAFAGLMWSTLQDGTEHFKHVDEVMTNPQAFEGKARQLHGYVVPGSILVKHDTLEYKFKVQNNPICNGNQRHGVEASDTFIAL